MMMVAATRPYEEDTELEGRLEDVSLHPSTPRFAIYDPLTDMPIRCEFSTADVDVVAELLKRRARVRVAGMARYNKNHRPMSITVRAITPLPEQKDLPQMKDLRKAKIDITGGASPVDHIRELRDGH
jgi:hypothetical protein